jgi:putative chitinase
MTHTLTLDELSHLLPDNNYLQQWHKVLVELLPQYEINTPARIAAFIAQCAHESANFTVLKENLNYRAATLRKIFPKYFPTDEIAQAYASQPNKQEAIANVVYSNRMGNGSPETGDGYRFCGRGLIQLTGRDNYTWFAESLEISVEAAAEYLETFEGAVQSACWFWETNNLNTWADAGDILTLTKKINGGTIGLQDRIAHYEHALNVLTA